MALEIERKFLVPTPPEWLPDCDSEHVRQGYLAIEPDGAEVRVRELAGTSTLTVKSGHGETRRECEIPLDDDQFTALWELTSGRRLRKRRHYVEHDGQTIEVDVYEDELDGLVTAEVEFDSAEASEAFEPIDWFGADITGESDYANQALASSGLPNHELAA